MSDEASSHARKHEQFDVDGRRAAEQQIRQDRFEPSEWTCCAVIGGHELALGNYSAFGLAVVAPEAVECDEAVDATLRLRDVEVARLRLRRVRVERLADGRCKTAFAIIGEPLNLMRLDAIGRAQAAVDDHARAVAETAAVPAPFRAQVYEIKHALEELERRINQLGDAALAVSRGDERELELSVAAVVADHLERLFAASYDQLGEVAATFSPDEIARCHAFFRQQLAHLLYQSPLIERSYRKPLGYAGDYEMMSLVYRNEELGKSLFAKCLSRYYINHPNARAVRNRAVYLHGRLVRLIAERAGKRTRILSVASGPAQEIQILLEDERIDLGDVEIHLLDQDVSALRAAQQQILRIAARRGVAPRIQFVHKAMANVIKGGLDGQYDFIYSAGLFDYFSDPIARRAASRLYRLLDDGGQVVIGNFKAVAQNRAFMELALDWELIYRSESDLRALYGGIAGTLDIEAEPEQINLFVNLRR